MSDKSFFAIGIDEGALRSGTLLYEKSLEYGKVFSRVFIICRSSSKQSPETVGNVTFYPVYTSLNAFFPIKVLFVGVKTIRDGQWVISSDNPFELGLVAWFLASIVQASLYLQVHTDFLSPYFRRASSKEYIRFLLAKFLIPRAAYLRVVSERIKQSILTTFPACAKSSASRQFPLSNISVFPIFTDIQKYQDAQLDLSVQERLKSYTFRVITVGRFFDKEKNFSLLISMMPSFLKSCPEALLMIVGEGPDYSKYKKQIQSLGLEKHVLLEPWRTDLQSLYRSFDMFLLSSNYEGWGRVVIEAMAAGLPIVMTDVGLAGEIVQNNQNGLIVPVGDRKKMLEACEILLRDPSKRKSFIEAGFKSIERLETTTKDRYLDLYRRSLEETL